MSGRTRRVGAHEAMDYLAMADEFQAGAEGSAAAGRFRLAGMSAIHAAISAADAVCIFEMNERSNSSNHDDAADLLRRSGAPGAREKAEQLAAVLRVKNKVEYESRPIADKETRDIIKRSGRLVEWARRVVKG